MVVNVLMYDFFSILQIYINLSKLSSYCVYIFKATLLFNFISV